MFLFIGIFYILKVYWLSPRLVRQALTPQMRNQYETAGGKRVFLENYIAKRLLVQEAEGRGYDDQPQVKQALEIARESALFDRYVRDIVASEVVPDSAVREFYDKNVDDFVVGDRIRVQQIVIGTNRHSPAEAAEIARGRLRLDPARHRVRWDGRDVTLTVTEFMILEALAQRPGVVKSRNQLMDVAYQDDIYVDDRTIDSHIKRMRRKFREADPAFKAIETLYGVGYRFAEE